MLNEWVAWCTCTLILIDQISCQTYLLSFCGLEIWVSSFSFVLLRELVFCFVGRFFNGLTTCFTLKRKVGFMRSNSWGTTTQVQIHWWWVGQWVGHLSLKVLVWSNQIWTSSPSPPPGSSNFLSIIWTPLIAGVPREKP